MLSCSWPIGGDGKDEEEVEEEEEIEEKHKEEKHEDKHEEKEEGKGERRKLTRPDLGKRKNSKSLYVETGYTRHVKKNTKS